MKKKLIYIMMALLAVVFVSATLITYFGRVTTDITVDQAVTLTGTGCTDNNCVDSIAIAGGEKVTSNLYTLSSITSVDAPIEIVTTLAPPDAGIVTTLYYDLSASGTPGTERRVFISAADAGLSTLSDLTSISWDQDVKSGYVSHVDVIIDKDGDGVRDDALVFEYAKVDPSHCEETPYPTGVMNTFGALGIVDDSANAWLSSGAPGPGCVATGTFYADTLANWKLGYQGVSGATKVIGLEFEVDNWIVDSESVISNIEINSTPNNLITLQAGNMLDFYTVTQFGLGHVGNYVSTTQVNIR